MRIFAFAFILTMPMLLNASVVDLQKTPVQEVLEVYQEDELLAATDQGWIHNFERASLGKEMDHLAKLKTSSEITLME